MSKDLVLWGFHPRYKGPDGSVKPIKLTAGSLGWCRVEQASRTKAGGWTLGIYAKGDAPEGLRAQCKEAGY